MYLLPLIRSTWAPKGKTPQILEKWGREHLSLIAAISEKGALHYQCWIDFIDGHRVALFLKDLCYHYRKYDISLIWDGAKIHRSEAVKQFLRQRAKRIELHLQPAYSPELNACEMLWAYLKMRLANRVFLDIDELQEAVRDELETIKKNKKLIQSFFQHKEVAFFLN